MNEFIGKFVWVYSILSRSNKLHMKLKPYVGRCGYVLGISKNNQLLIEFGNREVRCIPAGCVVLYGTKAYHGFKMRK